MPRVHLTREDSLSEHLVTLIYGTMKVRHISQFRMADKLGISQQAFGKKLKRKQFTFSDLTVIFQELEFSDEQILSVMRGK